MVDSHTPKEYVDYKWSFVVCMTVLFIESIWAPSVPQKWTSGIIANVDVIGTEIWYQLTIQNMSWKVDFHTYVCVHKNMWS